MTPTELKQPRYKVIADYPGNPFPVGTILIPDLSHGELYSPIAGYSLSAQRIYEKDAHKYSHLIEKLEWWEDRADDEMPEYVRFTKQYCGQLEGSVYKTCEDWTKPSSTPCHIFFINHFKEPPYNKVGVPGGPWVEPATKEEFLNQVIIVTPQP